MSAHGTGAPIGDQARDTTARPHTGRHRARFCDICPDAPVSWRYGGACWERCAQLGRCGLHVLPLPPDFEDEPFYAGGMSRREERLADRADDPYQPDHQETPR